MSDPLDRVREAALELPETEERLSHGQPTFFVAGKQFAQFRDNHHGDHKTVVCVRVSSLDEQAMLLEADPDTYSKPAYLPELGFDQSRRRNRRLGPCRRPHCGQAGSLQRRAACWKLADDERIAIEAPQRRRWINLGELIALAALIVSAAGVWISWKSSADKDDGPTQDRRADSSRSR